MANNNNTHITFVLDRSGSMASVWGDVEGGFDKFISDQKAEEGECSFTLVAFDNQIDTLLTESSIKNVVDPLKEHSIKPRGSTALLDAIGNAIESTGRQLRAMKEDDRPGKVIFVVQTDGEENSSHEFTASTIKEKIEHQTEKYNWQFLFLGADLSSVKEAEKYGFSSLQSAVYNTKNMTGTMDQVSLKMSSVRRYKGDVRDVAYAETVNFSEQERSVLASTEA